MFAFHVFAALTLALAPQGKNQVRVAVRDDVGASVAYALVSWLGAGTTTVASDSGVAVLRGRALDSVNVRVRRIGYREHLGWVRRGSDGTYLVSLTRLAVSLSAVEVSAGASSARTELAQRGFYDRVARVQRGAILG